MRKAIDWSAVDWSKSSAVLAAELGVDITTVSRHRKTSGHPPLRLLGVRPHLAELNRRPERRAAAAQIQPIATAAAKKSAKAGKGAQNIRAVEWVLISPAGTRYAVRNLYHFVRTHEDLFARADVTWKRNGRSVGEWCNATAGILNIKGGRAKSWKGWRLSNES